MMPSLPRLVIDAAAIELARKRLCGAAIAAGPDGAFLEPGVVDLVDQGSDEQARWQPADARTTQLMLGAEACRDVVFHLDRVLVEKAHPRAIRGLVVPACNMMDAAAKLLVHFNDVQSQRMRQVWRASDRITYKEVGRRLKKKHLRGPVRTARNKIGAHLDISAYQCPVRVAAEEILRVIGDSVVLLLLILNHDAQSFSWIRSLGASEDRCIVETLFDYPVATRWLTDREGHVLDVGHLQLAADPRHEIKASCFEAVRAYNDFAVLHGSSVPSIWIEEHDPPEKPKSDVRLAAMLNLPLRDTPNC